MKRERGGFPGQQMEDPVFENTVETYSPDETREVAFRLGSLARAGEIYTLNGDLGAGKTVFAQGFAAGMGIDETVNSPTFTIVQEYTGRLPLYHFDVYRIEEPEEMEEIGYEEYFFGSGVCLIEWAEQIRELLPGDRTDIFIGKDPGKGFDYRILTIRKPGGEGI